MKLSQILKSAYFEEKDFEEEVKFKERFKFKKWKCMIRITDGPDISKQREFMKTWKHMRRRCHNYQQAFGQEKRTLFNGIRPKLEGVRQRWSKFNVF